MPGLWVRASPGASNFVPINTNTPAVTALKIILMSFYPAPGTKYWVSQSPTLFAWMRKPISAGLTGAGEDWGGSGSSCSNNHSKDFSKLQPATMRSRINDIVAKWKAGIDIDVSWQSHLAGLGEITDFWLNSFTFLFRSSPSHTLSPATLRQSVSIITLLLKINQNRILHTNELCKVFYFWLSSSLSSYSATSNWPC